MRTVTRIRIPRGRYGLGCTIYFYLFPVLHPDIHDACALLDAAADEEGTAVIKGIGTRTSVDRIYAFNDVRRNFILTEYRLHNTWRQSC